MLRTVLALSCVLVALAYPVLREELDEHWDLYKTEHQKQYESKQEETLR